MPTKEDLIAVMNSEAEHHLFSCSGSHQWLECGMSIWEQFGLPDSSSSAAEEGTRAHALAERCLERECSPERFLGEDGVDLEMAYFVEQYIKYVNTTLGENSKRWIEQRINLNDWILGGGGTADVVGLTRDGDLHIIDLKYGKGVQVFAKDNPQLKLYGLGALWAMVKAKRNIRNIWLHIAQPRLFHYDAWCTNPEDLYDFGDHVSTWVERCLNKDVDYNPSERACQWCKAQATCAALYQHNVAVITNDFENLEPIPANKLTDEQLKLVIDNKALIEKWLKSVEAHVFSRLERGEKFDGYKMVEGRSIRKYTDNAQEVLEKILGENAYEKKLIGITAAEKLVGKKQFTELGITEKPPGKPVLAPESDKREALPNFSDDFENLELKKD